ncbi:MAG: class I SAM-dependent methyltransferase [Desulfobacca sp.]|nr:class I SAM-dependent methyltransferase [Desulfobacca sp.]
MQPKVITESRWKIAQNVEKNYWARVKCDPQEYLRIIHEKYVFLNKINSNCPEVLNPPNGRPGQALEIGIGSLGIGVLSLLDSPSWELTGIDPQPQIQPDGIPSHLQALHQELMKKPLEYIQRPAENLGLESSSYDLAACYNVLDHTHNPYAILQEIYRVLRPGGYFLLGLDALCLLNWMRFKAFIDDPPHPYKFTPWHVERLLPNQGFKVLI